MRLYINIEAADDNHGTIASCKGKTDFPDDFVISTLQSDDEKEFCDNISKSSFSEVVKLLFHHGNWPELKFKWEWEFDAKDESLTDSYLEDFMSDLCTQSLFEWLFLFAIHQVYDYDLTVKCCEVAEAQDCLYTVECNYSVQSEDDKTFHCCMFLAF